MKLKDQWSTRVMKGLKTQVKINMVKLVIHKGLYIVNTSGTEKGRDEG